MFLLAIVVGLLSVQVARGPLHAPAINSTSSASNDAITRMGGLADQLRQTRERPGLRQKREQASVRPAVRCHAIERPTVCSCCVAAARLAALVWAPSITAVGCGAVLGRQPTRDVPGVAVLNSLNVAARLRPSYAVGQLRFIRELP